MTSAIVSYLHRHKSRQTKRGAAAATGERKSDDNAHKAAEGYRQPNRDEEDDLAPARGIAVSVLVGTAMWLAIIALVLLITWFFWDST